MIFNAFAGAGGWEEGLRLLERDDIVGFEIDKWACATRKAAGHKTVRCDVTTVPLEHLRAEGVIASPPCPTFSQAGKRAGTKELDVLLDLIDFVVTNRWVDPWQFYDWSDPRTVLVLEPLRWVKTLEPEWIALEQVPSCLPLWKAYSKAWIRMGYSVWCDIVNSADYGVPQTRKRAILLASNTRRVYKPKPTHTKNPHPVLFDPREKWITMAEALGWGFDDRPAPIVTGGGADTGGVEPFANHAMRQRLKELQSESPWVFERPSMTLVSSFRPEVVAAPGYRKAGDGPRQNAAGSVKIGIEEASVLQSFRSDYPWQGSKNQQFKQCGLAIPVLLAKNILARLI